MALVWYSLYSIVLAALLCPFSPVTILISHCEANKGLSLSFIHPLSVTTFSLLGYLESISGSTGAREGLTLGGALVHTHTINSHLQSIYNPQFTWCSSLRTVGETGALGGNSHHHQESMQTPHRKSGPWFKPWTLSVWGNSATYCTAPPKGLSYLTFLSYSYSYSYSYSWGSWVA